MPMSPLLPDGRPAQVPLTEHVKIRLRLHHQAHFHFLHGAALQGLLSRSLGRSLPAGFAPLALESGQVRFAAGEAYDFVVTSWGPSRQLLPELIPALRAFGQRRPRKGADPLDGGFDVETVSTLPLPTLEECLAKAEKLAEQGSVRILFHTPLRLLGPSSSLWEATPFPLGAFLGQLWRSYSELCGEEKPIGRGPFLPRSLAAQVDHLQWLDLPLQGRFDARVPRLVGERISGVCGSVSLEGLPEAWVRLLALMENARVGSAAQFGFGAFALEQVPAWRRPARTFAERLGDRTPTPQLATELLAPSALALLDDGAAFHHRGLSCFSAEIGRQRAKEMGLNGPVGGANTRFVARCCPEEVVGRLRALWPAEPLIEHFPAWLRRPEKRQELGRLLAKVFASELADTLLEEGRWLVRVGSELRVLGREAARVA